MDASNEQIGAKRAAIRKVCSTAAVYAFHNKQSLSLALSIFLIF
jgi:hypothetical protein